MMQKEDIAKLAQLARIEVGEEETKSLAKDIEAILSYVQQVQEISAANTAQEKTEIKNVFREDAPPAGGPHESGIYTDALLSVAPEKEERYIKVKKIL